MTSRSDADLDTLRSALLRSWDNEIEVGIIASHILRHGPEGIDILIRLLIENSKRHPKLSVGILNALNQPLEPYARRKLVESTETGRLSDQDDAYIITILRESEPNDTRVKSRLMASLRRAKDPVDRSELLGDIVRLHLRDAIPILKKIAAQISPDSLNYSRSGEKAMREEMVIFALLALEGQTAELERIAFDQRNPSPRRTSSLEFLCLSLGPSCTEILHRAMGDQNRLLRGTAVGLVGELRDLSSLGILKEGLNDDDLWVVQQAAYAIMRLAKLPDFTSDLEVVKGLRARVRIVEQKWSSSPESSSGQVLVRILKDVGSYLESLLR